MSAEVPERVSVDPLFLAVIVMMFLIVAQIFVRSETLKWIFSIGWIFAFIFLFTKIFEKQLKGGPAVGQFRRRMAKVRVSVDGDELVVPSGQALKIRDDFGGHVPKLEDQPWPAFPADLMSIAIVTATQCDGVILMFEKMF